MANEESRQRDTAASRVHTADEAQERTIGREALARKAKLDLPDPAKKPKKSPSDSAPVADTKIALDQGRPARKRNVRITAADIPVVIPEATDASAQGLSPAVTAKMDASSKSSDAVADEARNDGEADGAREDEVRDERTDDADGMPAGDGALRDAAVQGAQAAQPDADEVEAPRDKTPFFKVFFGLLAVAVALAIAAASWLAWDRWGRYDDRADMQGDWYVEGTAVLVPIDATTIKLADDVVYKYEIDDHDKTISYTFGDWAGSGRYWFSDDRRTLVITDGDEFTGVGNTVDDLVQLFNDRMTIGNGETVELPEGDGIIVFRRSPDIQAFIVDTIKKARAEQEAAKNPEGEYLDDEYYDEYYDE